MKTFIKIHPGDSVAVALSPLSAGTALQVDGQAVALLEDIPQGHKFALADIPEGAPILKYGAPIGVAKADIPAGGWVHTHNIKTGLGDVLDYSYEPNNAPLAPTDDVLFQGYRRADGRAAVRNEIWIIPTVGCVNNVAQAIERQCQRLKRGT
ncbi:MAG: altronate dehydratase family protein, partial [Oscillospiraceae bacterium]|nr:altronate dehydratase family protein [Oscillospiraceae bacterium]